MVVSGIVSECIVMWHLSTLHVICHKTTVILHYIISIIASCLCLAYFHIRIKSLTKRALLNKLCSLVASYKKARLAFHNVFIKASPRECKPLHECDHIMKFNVNKHHQLWYIKNL